MSWETASSTMGLYFSCSSRRVGFAASASWSAASGCGCPWVKEKAEDVFTFSASSISLDLFSFGEEQVLRSAVDKLRHQNLLGLCLAGVHQPHPAHRIAGFQLLRRAADSASWGIICSRRLFAVSSISSRCGYSFSLISRWFVDQGPVFLQVRFPHPAVLAQGLLRLLAQAQIGIR